MLIWISCNAFVNSMCVGGIKTFWAQKITQEKLTIFAMILKYINFSCTIFCTKPSQYSHYTYCLQKQLKHFGLRVFTHFGLEVSEQFGKESQNNLWQIVPKLKLLTTWLTHFFLTSYPNLFISDLTHTNCSNSVFQSSLK